MIQITNNGTKDVCFPNQFGNFCIPSGETCPISVEQFQRLKKNCPDVLGDITVDLGTTPPGFELANYTILCDTADSSIYYLTYRKQLEDTGVIENITITMPSGVETVGLPPATAKPCQDSKVVTKCRKVVNGTGYDYYTELICMVGIVVVGDMYLNHQDGSVSTTRPIGAIDCDGTTTANVPNCDGTTTATDVDKITATYLLNQANKHTEKVYDIALATINGPVTYTYTAPHNINVNYSLLVTTNDIIKYIRTDYGDSYSDIGPNPDHSYNNDGAYEVKSYAVMESGNKIELFAQEVTILNGVVTYSAPTNPITYNRVYEVTVGCALQEYCDGVLVGIPYNADTTAYTIIGTIGLCEAPILDELEDNAEFGEECNLFPITNCFCAMVSGSATRKETTEKAKATSAAPVKSTICETLRYDCKQVVKAKTYTIAGKPYTATQFASIKYTKIECNAPTPTYSAGAVTCTTYPDPIDGIIVLNATVYTNDSNPSDVQTIYTLASTYPTVGGIGDIYLVADETLLVDCPPGSIVETETCFEALVDIKGVAVTGDMINVQSVQNLTAGTTRYTITHVSSGAIIYSGVDPIADAGIDTSNVAERVSVPCEATPPVIYQLFERDICATIDGVPQKYELVKVYTRDPITGAMTVIRYEDTFGNVITGAVEETCCDCSAICYGSVVVPLANRRSDSYGAFTAQYRTWIDDGQYDSIYAGRGPVGAPRNHYYEVKVFDASNTQVSTAVLGPYAVDPSNTTYLQFLSDVSALTSSLGVSLIGASPVNGRGGYQIEYNNTVGFSITFRHGIDNHAGGIQRNPDIKQAIRYETSRSEVRDSVQTTGDFNNPALDAGGREWTNMRGVTTNTNVTVI